MRPAQGEREAQDEQGGGSHRARMFSQLEIAAGLPLFQVSMLCLSISFCQPFRPQSLAPSESRPVHVHRLLVEAPSPSQPADLMLEGHRPCIPAPHWLELAVHDQ